MRGAKALQESDLLGSPNDVDERDAVGEADAIQHLAKVRCRRRVHERRVVLAPHRLHHRKSGEWVHEPAGALFGRRPLGQRQALRDRDRAMLGECRAADDTDRLSDERLRCC